MRKKYLLASALCVLSMATLTTGCNSNNDDNISSENSGASQEQQKDFALINGFENWDDLQELEIDKTLFYGSLSVNHEAEYVSEGKASAKYEIDKVGANNPSFKLLATAKSDITDVCEFGLYIYNANTYDFSVIISALDGSNGVIYTQDAKAVTGENVLSFTVDRQMVQMTGSSVAKYQIAFNGLKGDSVIYVDNFYAKLDSSEVELDADVKSVISAIESLNRKDRTAIEATMAQYKALDVVKRKSVHNYQILKVAMDSFWLEDLTVAREEDSHTLLFFDKPFAEVQIGSVTHSISACEYTTQFGYGDEAGSLKVSFTKSSVNWVTVDTTADVPIDDGYIELHIYNESTQNKLISLGWNGPNGASSSWEIKANSWLDIECPSTYLTANKGGIQIAGYDNGKGVAPEGNLYISAVRTFDLDSKYNELRVGNDVNTLFFFDTKVGEKQLKDTEGGITHAHSTEKSLKGENGSMKVSFDGNTPQYATTYSMYGYEYSDDDYVVFYVYNDTNTDFVSLLFSYDNGVRLAKGVWTMVVRKIEEIATCHLRFMGQNYAEVNGVPTANQVQAQLSGSVYLSKAKVYTSNEVKALSHMTETAEWTLGDTTFVGATQKYNGAPNALMNNPLEYEPYMINNELRINLWAHDYAGLYAKLKTPIELSSENKYVAITLKGAEIDKFTILPLGTDGQYDAFGSKLYPVNVLNNENGYVTYLFKIAKMEDQMLGGLRITPIGSTNYKVMVDGTERVIPTAKATEIMISNVTIGNTDVMRDKNYFEGMLTLDRVGSDANTLFFFDRKAGEEQVTEISAGMTYGYTTDKAYASEKGALKVTLPGNVAHNTLKYDMMEYAYNEGDYAVFYVYNDTDSDFVQLMFGYNNSVYLEKGKWTAVVRPVSVVASQYFRFFSMNNTKDGAPADWTSANANGSLYVSKAKVYSASEITNLTKVTGDWTIGNTTFSGVLKLYNNAIGNATYAGFLADDLQYAPYIFNGAMYMTLWEHSYAGFYATLKTGVSVANETQYVAITAKGADATKFTMLPLGENGEYDAFTGSLKPVKTIAGTDGNVTYIFEVPKTTGRTINGLRVTPLGDTTGSWKAVNISISNMEIGDKKEMVGKGYLSAE